MDVWALCTAVLIQQGTNQEKARFRAKPNGRARVGDRPARILLVEDDPDVRPLLEHVLLGAGHIVDVAATYAGALELLNTDTVYDLVLSDGRLGDGSGIGVADRAKARGAKTLIITGYALQFPQEDLARHPYIWKPVRGTELLAVVARCLEGET
jgi:CheY-like chemotaxis protein